VSVEDVMLSRCIVYSILLHSTATLPAMYIGEGEKLLLRLVSRTQALLTKIRQVCNEVRDIKLDVQSHQRNNKYVYSVNRKHTRGMHIINK
jgi:hypothetical protein